MRSPKRLAIPHSKSTPMLQKEASRDRDAEDFREVRSRLRKTSSRSPSKPPVTFRPDPPTHYSPPARLETTSFVEEQVQPQSQPQPQQQPQSAGTDQVKPKESKGKEREAPRLVRTATDHNDCLKDNGWQPPPKAARDHKKCLDDFHPVRPASVPVDQKEAKDQARGRAREQEMRPSKEAPRDHAPRQASGTGRETTSSTGRAMDSNHECEWKDRYKTLKSDLDTKGRTDDIGLEGLTIVLHMQGRDDLVINTDLRNLE